MASRICQDQDIELDDATATDENKSNKGRALKHIIYILTSTVVHIFFIT